MKINKSAYYKWLKRDINQYIKDRIELTKELIEEHKKHPSYGYHRLAIVIRNKLGWMFSDNLVHKCCKAAGIKSKARKYKRWNNPGEKHVYYDNITWGWKSKRPLEKITTDMTIIKNNGKKYELTFYLDAFNNEILTYRLSGKCGDRATYIDGLKDLLIKIKEEKPESTILHSDQGSVYSSLAYNKLIEDYNIQRSMSRAGTPTDNAKIEAINGWVKEELYKDFKVHKSENIFKTIKEYIHYYNHERPCFALKYKTPHQYKIDMGY